MMKDEKKRREEGKRGTVEMEKRRGEEGEIKKRVPCKRDCQKTSYHLLSRV